MILPIFLILFSVATLLKTFLLRMNYRHLRQEGRTVPHQLEGRVDGDKLRRIVEYNSEKMRFQAIVFFFDRAVLLAVLLSGVLPFVDSRLSATDWPPMISGLLFFVVMGLGSWIIDVPFDLYGTFVLEKKYDFTTQTLRGWLSDQGKGLLVGGLLGGLVLAAIFAIILFCGSWWWLIAWMILLLFNLLLSVIYPVLIAPIFNRFTPIEEESLKEKIAALARKASLGVKGIFKMDAGRRTRHSNAYFTGFGKTKRIVLFDTLLEKHPEGEIVAILSHEIGHWKRKHQLKLLLFSEILSFAGLYLCSLLIMYPPIYRAFGFEGTPFYVGLFLIGVLFGPVSFFVGPLASILSRHFEREADRYAFEVSDDGRHFEDALTRLALDNLANLTPHPLYVKLFYSHPPILTRIDTLRSWAGNLSGGEAQKSAGTGMIYPID